MKVLYDYKKDLFTNKKVKEFCTNNKLTDQDIISNLSDLYLFKEAQDICDKCDGKKCMSLTPNMVVDVEYDGVVKLSYADCSKATHINEGSIELLSFSPSDEKELYDSAARNKLFIELDNFQTEYQNNKKAKGLYVHGRMGCGKTFILYRFALELSKQGSKVIFAYYPDLVRMLKSSINDNQLEKQILKLKKVDVLFLDDFGGEVNTPFVRDEIIGPILQYRMDNHLPIFITSNLDYQLLGEHLSETSLETNKIKALRILERIKFLTKPVLVDDKDYRRG